MPLPRQHRARLVAAASELPWLVVAGIAAAGLLAAIPTLNHPWGSNWPMYFEAARYFWDPSAAYFGWRPPLYPLMLATLGQGMGYVEAAHLIAQASMVVVVFGSGWIARMCVGRGGAMLASLSVPLMQCAVEGAMWTNMYPPAAALLTLAAALGVALYRRPGLVLALAAGVAAGLAWRLNHLGLVAIPLGMGMAVLGARSWLRLALLPVLFGLGVSTTVALDTWIVDRWSVPQEGLADQVIQRRREELERIASGQVERAQFSACTQLEPRPLNWPELTNACARQFIDANHGTLRAEDCAPPLSVLAWLLPLCLLPSARRRSWRDSAASVLLFGGPLGAFLVAAAWTSYAEKYVISFLSVMVLMAPLAFDRAGGWLGRLIDRVDLGRALGLIAAVVWVINIWPGAQALRADAPNIQRDWETVSGDVAAWARTSMGEDDLLIDCVPLNVDLVILPKTANIIEGIGTEADCIAWVAKPPPSKGQTFLVQQAFYGQPHTAPEYLLDEGWQLVRTMDDSHRLWRR